MQGGNSLFFNIIMQTCHKKNTSNGNDKDCSIHSDIGC